MNTYTVGRSSAQGGTLCCGRVGYFVSCHTLCVVVPHTLYGVTHFGTECGGIGDWRKWLKFTLHWQEPQDPGPQDLLHTNLNPGTYGHKISSEKTLRQWNSICPAGTGQKKPEVKIGWEIWLPQDFIYFCLTGRM